MIGTTTRTVYKVTNGVFKKHKVLDLLVSVMRLFIVIAAKHQLNQFKSDTKQAFLNWDISEEKIYLCPPVW